MKDPDVKAKQLLLPARFKKFKILNKQKRPFLIRGVFVLIEEVCQIDPAFYGLIIYKFKVKDLKFSA